MIWTPQLTGTKNKGPVLAANSKRQYSQRSRLLNVIPSCSRRYIGRFAAQSYRGFRLRYFIWSNQTVSSFCAYCTRRVIPRSGQSLETEPANNTFYCDAKCSARVNVDVRRQENDCSSI